MNPTLPLSGTSRASNGVPDREESARLPSVSVVMPIRNEAQFIEESLEALLDQDYPQDRLELIVVDGMSEDGTRAIVQRLADRNRNMVLVDNPRRITPAGMNLGIRRATGTVILRVDGHAVVPRDYVNQCLEWLLKSKAEGVGGAVNSTGTSYVGEAIAVGMSSPFGVGSSGFRTAGNHGKPVRVDTLPFWAFRRRVFDRIGMFNEQMVRHQDYELNYRLRQSGGEIFLLPWLRVKYYVRSTMRKLWRQYWQYGIWKGRFLRTHPRSLRLRHLAPPVLVMALLLALLLTWWAPALGARCLAALAGCYLSFLFAATLWLGLKEGFKHTPLIPLILASIHLTWGAGIWAGLMSGKIPRIQSPMVDLAR